MKTLTKKLLAVLTVLTMLGTLGITALAEGTEDNPKSINAKFVISMNNKSGASYLITKNPSTVYVKNTVSPVFPFDLKDEITDDQLAKLSKAELQCTIAFGSKNANDNVTAFDVTAVPITKTDKTNFKEKVYDEMIKLDDKGTISNSAEFWEAGGGTEFTQTVTAANATEVKTFDVTQYVQTQPKDDKLYFIKLYTNDVANGGSAQNNTVKPGVQLVLTFSDAMGDLNSISIPATAKEDFTLPAKGENGSEITWASSDASTIAIEGSTARVTRPSLSDGNKTVTLTATATLDTDVQTRNFTVTVLCLQNVSENIVRATSVADTFVTKGNADNGYSDKDYSDNNYLYINGTGRHSFLRFNVEDKQNIENAVAAKLYMYIAEVKSGTAPTVMTLGLQETDRTSWEEEGLTYNQLLTAGILNTNGDERYGRGQYIDTVPTEKIIAGEWVSVDITSYLKENCASDGIAAFRLYGSPTAKISSRETDYAPYIELYSGDTGAVIADTDAIKLPSCVFESFTLPTAGANGSSIEWASDNAAIAVSGGTAAVTPVDADTEVTLTATISKGDETDTKAFKVKVLKEIFTFSGGLSAETVTVSVADGYVMPSENVIYIAKYDTEGQLIGMALPGEAITVTEDIATIKAFMWKKASLRPISLGILSK